MSDSKISENSSVNEWLVLEDQEAVIVRFKRCLERIWDVDDKHDWPIKLNSVSHLFAREFSEDFLRVLDLLMEQGYTEGEIAKLFGHPTQIFRLFDLLLKGMYMIERSTKDKRNYVHKILRCIQSLKTGSIFNEDGRNQIITEAMLQTIYTEKVMKVSCRDQALEIQIMIGLLKGYIEQLYFRGYDIAQEIHGPYPLKGGSKLIIREFHNLAPKELWNELQFVPYPSIKIYCIYDSSLDITIDAYGHMCQRSGVFYQNLKIAGLEIAGEQISLSGCKKITEALAQCISYNTRQFKDIDWKTVALKYADIFYYKLQPLYQAAGDTPLYYEYIRENIKDGAVSTNSEAIFQPKKLQMLLNLLI